jgi:hypothetical protein
MELSGGVMEDSKKQRSIGNLVAGRSCALEVKYCTHWPSKLGDSDGRGSQSEPNHGDPYNRREYGNYYEDTLPRRHGEPGSEALTVLDHCR